MRRSNYLKKLINDLAIEVINLYEISIPISDIDLVVKRMGGKVFEDPSMTSISDGKIRKTRNSSFEISVSPFQTEERRNFTIAHELGHLFLHMRFGTERWKQQICTPYYSNDSMYNYQADKFALSFLMPQIEYKRIMDKNTEGNIVNTLAIAKYFHVSVDAAANRGKWLGYLKW